MTIIYDCGTVTKSKDKILGREIDRIKAKTIDILFISHFDVDHINGIPKLLDKKIVKTVVLPQIDNTTKYLSIMKAIDKGADEELISLISDPRDYLEQRNIQVIEVTPISSEDITDSIIEASVKGMTNMGINDIYIGGTPIQKSGTMKSGAIIQTRNVDWGWIPFNIDFGVNNRLITQEIKMLGGKYPGIIDINGNIDQHAIISKLNDTNFHKDMKKIYETNLTVRGINENSLVMYSGPVCNATKDQYYLNNTPAIYRRKTGCLYCGDYNAQRYLKQLKDCYNSVWERIGTIQIPHHGSDYNFPTTKEAGKLIDNIPIIIISAGKGRKKHPGTDVIEILEDKLKNNKIEKYYHVTEHVASRHRQCIWRRN